MKEIYQTSQFKKDCKRAKKRGKDIEKLKHVVGLIIKDEPLDEKYRDHGLVGKWTGSRDCHNRTRLAVDLSSRWRCSLLGAPRNP